MAFDEHTVQQVWDSARALPSHDPTLWRQDQCGAWIKRDHYAALDSDYGWHIENVTSGEADRPENLRAFHRENHFDRANGTPHCRIRGEPETLVNIRI